MKIPVQVRLETEGGALSESFEATLVIKSRFSASIERQLDFNSLTGSLTFTPSDASCAIMDSLISVNMVFTPYNISGSISVPYNCDIGGGIARFSSFDAYWPAESLINRYANDSGCGIDRHEISLDSSWGEFSSNDAIDLVNDAERIILTSEKGVSTRVELHFEPESQNACLILVSKEYAEDTNSPTAGSYSVRGILSMSNANNGFIGRYDAVDFLAKPDDTGRLEQVTLSVYRIPISDLDTLLSLDSEDTPINPEIDKEYFGMREAQTTIRFEPTINGSTVSGELKYRATSPLTTSELDEQNIVTFIWSN